MIVRTGNYMWHTNGFMAFETLELAEALNLSAVVIDLNEHETSQDAADFIEYAFGDTSTKMGALRARDGRQEPYRPFRIELGNEEPCQPEFVANVARVAGAMVGKARQLGLKRKLQFAVGGPCTPRTDIFVHQHWYLSDCFCRPAQMKSRS